MFCTPVVEGAFELFCKPLDYDPARNWVHRRMFQPRTFQSWLHIWQTEFQPVFPLSKVPQPHMIHVPIPSYDGGIPDPFYHREVAKTQFEAVFLKSQWVRARIRALIRARRIRIMKQRLIGERDVGTLDLIPEHHKVRVYDWKTKAIYQFHTNTIHKSLSQSLRFQSYAIAMPKYPKNPYTNLPWSVAQLTVLVDQIHTNLWKSRQRFMDSFVQLFRLSQFELGRFHVNCGHQIDIECARIFFREGQGEEWTTVYSETLADIEVISAFCIPAHIRTRLLDRVFPPGILVEWDELVLGIWGYQNLNRMITAGGSILDLIAMAKTLLDRTKLYLRTLQKAKPRTNGCTPNRAPVVAR